MQTGRKGEAVEKSLESLSWVSRLSIDNNEYEVVSAISVGAINHFPPQLIH